MQPLITPKSHRRCACGNPLGIDMDYFCSTQCAREDSLRALSASPSHYRSLVAKRADTLARRHWQRDPVADALALEIATAHIWPVYEYHGPVPFADATPIYHTDQSSSPLASVPSPTSTCSYTSQPESFGAASDACHSHHHITTLRHLKSAVARLTRRIS